MHGLDAAQDGLHPRHDFARTVRFADVVVGPQFQSEQTIDFLDPGRGHDDGHPAEAADLPAD